MNIEEYIHHFPKFSSKPSLESMQYLIKHLDYPCSNLKIIHIAGTNGKGSVAEMLSSILIHAGYKVGKFLSPHLIDFNERISVNNVPITDVELNKLILHLNPIVTAYNQNHTNKILAFDIITALALMHFENMHCDFAILEVGLGGLYDSTNVITPAISIITSIGYDHMGILGNTLEEIASQKAGIIKNNSHTIFFNQSKITKIIKDTCKAKNNQLHLIFKKDINNYSYTNTLQQFDYKNFSQISLNLKGKLQVYNAAICLECINLINQMNYDVPISAIRYGLKNIIHRGRFEILNASPLIIFDGAHNESAICNLNSTINRYYKHKKKVFIISILKSKDYKSIIRQLLNNNNCIFFFTDGVDNLTYVPKEELFAIANTFSNNSQIYMTSLADAINKAKLFYPNHIIFITGSFYTYKDCIQII